MGSDSVWHQGVSQPLWESELDPQKCSGGLPQSQSSAPAAPMVSEVLVWKVSGFLKLSLRDGEVRAILLVYLGLSVTVSALRGAG